MPVKYIAELKHVREVSLLGTADLAFWTDQLGKEGLSPTSSDGQALLLISAVDSQFKGIRFRELSFGNMVCRHKEGAQQDEFYLAAAFNTSRFFAFIERTFFSTPYFHGSIQIDVRLPACIQLTRDGDAVFRAEMTADPLTSGSREPLRSGDDGWEGPIFLPKNERKRDDQAKVFFARVRGHTQVYPFSPSDDRVLLKPSPDLPMLQKLIDSSFTGKEWIIREDATHARSKSFKRGTVRGF
jgi:hypothetical protein